MATLSATGAKLAGCASRVGVRRVAFATRPLARGTATVAPRDATRHFTTRAPRAAEMMGVPLYPDDLLEACAPWGNVCVVAGTHYIPIALPSILGTIFLLAPLLAAAAKLQQTSQEIIKKDLRIRELEAELAEARGASE